MKTPHVHAEFIKAWADGEQVEFFESCIQQWKPIGSEPCWFTSIKYRIKPEPKPDVVKYACFYTYEGNGYLSLRLYEVQQCVHGCTEQLKLTFDGETGKLKSVEVLK